MGLATTINDPGDPLTYLKSAQRPRELHDTYEFFAQHGRRVFMILGLEDVEFRAQGGQARPGA